MMTVRTLPDRFLYALMALLGTVFLSASGEIVPDAPGWTFVETEQPSFKVSGDHIGSWMLYDWQGKPLGVTKDDGNGRLVFNRQVPGYYRVRRTTGQFSFCATRQDPNRSEGSFFAVDSAFSQCSARGNYSCPWKNGDSLEVTAELLGKCGITHTRERIYSNALEESPGEYHFAGLLENAEKLKSNGAKSLGLLMDSPAWQRSPGRSLPSDLAATCRFVESAAKALDEHYDAWEFFNEQELGSVKEPSWEYAAALKAYAIGVRRGSARAVVLPGALSGIEHFGYGQNVFDAEISKYVQAFNLHTYVPLVGYSKFHADIRKFLKEAGVPDWQVWMTECGTELEGGAAGIDSFGRPEHSEEQEMVVAEFYPKSNVLHRFGGISRNWYFLFGRYSERCGHKVWGSMRYDGSVKPVHAAIATMNGELGSAEQLGAVKVGSGIRAFLYAQKDGSRTLVFWSPSPVDRGRDASEVLGCPDLCRRPISIAVANGDYRLVDMMGTPTEVSVANGFVSLVATRYPQYLTGKGIELPIARPSASIGRLANYEPQPDEDLTVIVRPKVNLADFSVINRKSGLELVHVCGKILVEVWNLSDAPKTGRISFSCGDVSGVPDQLVLPPWGKVEVNCNWKPPEDGGIDYALDIAGTFNEKRITRVRLPVTHKHRFLQGCEVQALPGWNDPKVWIRNDSAKSYRCGYDDASSGVKFEAEWDEGTDKWMYPIHRLKLPEEALSDVVYVEFEVKAEQDKVENDFSFSEFMFVDSSGGSRNVSYPAPGFNWEKRLVKLPDGCGDCEAIRVGANPRGGRLTYWVRNFKLIRRCSAFKQDDLP